MTETAILPSLPELPKPEMPVARVPFILNTFIRDNRAAKVLAKENIPPDFVFMGAAGNESLSMIAAGKFQNAILFDLNSTDIKAVHNVLKNIESCRDSEEFIDRMAPKIHQWITQAPMTHHQRTKSRRDEDYEYFSVLGIQAFPTSEAKVKELLQDMAQDPHSWLHPDRFSHIKWMQDQGRIQTAVMDITDPDTIDQLDNFIRDQKFKVGALYTSTIRRIISWGDGGQDYFQRKIAAPIVKRFDDNVATLLKTPPGAPARKLFIDTSVQDSVRHPDGSFTPVGHYPRARIYDPAVYSNYMAEIDRIGKEKQTCSSDIFSRAGNKYILNVRTYPATPETNHVHRIEMYASAVIKDNVRQPDAGFAQEDLEPIRYHLQKMLRQQVKGDHAVQTTTTQSGKSALVIQLSAGCKSKNGDPINLVALSHAAIENMRGASGRNR